ncbi:hypothetical protein SALBM135S_08391 [Streptomyces alboniger]
MSAKRREPLPAARKLGPLYPAAKDAVEHLDLGMSVKEAVEHARASVPGGHGFTPQQVVQAAHDLIIVGPDEECDAGADGAGRGSGS